LESRRFFKVILGASLTDIGQIADLVRAYAASGATCFDVAADALVLETVDATLKALNLPQDPLLMVSLPLDPDPHFRKIELDDPACIRCGLCVPICPALALSLPEADLEVSQTLCYGCGHCVPVCPTEALSMLPFQVEDNIATILSHPRVGAVEIHSHAVDPQMLHEFWIRWADGLRGKIVSLCFRPGEFLAEQLQAFCRVALHHSQEPILLQIDGAPMSGTPEPDASRPAIEAAQWIQAQFQGEADLASLPITISGGINAHTAGILEEPENSFIAGVGMGTMARTLIASLSTENAQPAARQLVERFQRR
jgi:ferredoxin